MLIAHSFWLLAPNRSPGQIHSLSHLVRRPLDVTPETRTIGIPPSLRPHEYASYSALAGWSSIHTVTTTPWIRAHRLRRNHGSALNPFVRSTMRFWRILARKWLQ